VAVVEAYIINRSICGLGVGYSNGSVFTGAGRWGCGCFRCSARIDFFDATAADFRAKSIVEDNKVAMPNDIEQDFLEKRPW
jgi:hypothetical protein